MWPLPQLPTREEASSLGPLSGCPFLPGLFPSPRNCVFSCRELTGRQLPVASPGPARSRSHQMLSACLPCSLKVLGIEVLQALLSSGHYANLCLKGCPPPSPLFPNLRLSSLMLPLHGVFRADHNASSLLPKATRHGPPPPPAGRRLLQCSPSPLYLRAPVTLYEFGLPSWQVKHLTCPTRQPAGVQSFLTL